MATLVFDIETTALPVELAEAPVLATEPAPQDDIVSAMRFIVMVLPFTGAGAVGFTTLPSGSSTWIGR